MLDPQLQSHIRTLWLPEIMVRLEIESFCPFHAEKCTFKNLKGILFFFYAEKKKEATGIATSVVLKGGCGNVSYF